MLNKHNILPSLSFVSVLTDNAKNIYDVLGSMTLFALKANNKNIFNREDATLTVNKYFEFELPSQIVNGALNNLCRDQLCEKISNNRYRFLQNTNEIYVNLKYDLDELNSIYNNLVSKLLLFIHDELQYNINENILKKSLYNKILYSEKYDDNIDTCIELFLLRYQEDKEIVDMINSLKKGAIIYTGVCSTPNLNILGQWIYELHLFLATDVIFSAFGINGDLQKKRATDFFNLAKEINENKKKIYFHLFEETREEINDFFYAAENIILYNRSVDKTKQGMLELIKDCSTRDDIIAKKAKLIQFLNSINCTNYNSDNIKNIDNFYLRTSKNIDVIKLECKASKILFDDEEIHKSFDMIEKINCYRNGNSKGRFFNAKFFYVTSKSLVNMIAKNVSVKYNERDIPLSTNISFLIERFWFALNKGFNSSENPTSFDMIARAKAAISSQLAEAVHYKFKELKYKLDNELINENTYIEMYKEYFSRMIAPENINSECITDIIDYINEDSIEQYIEERSLLKSNAEEGKRAIKKLEALKDEKILEGKVKYKRICKKHICIYKIITFIFNLFLISVFIFILEKFINCQIIQSICANIISVIIVSMTAAGPISHFINKKITMYCKKSYVNNMKWFRKNISERFDEY